MLFPCTLYTLLPPTGEFKDEGNPKIEWHPIQERGRGGVEILLHA